MSAKPERAPNYHESHNPTCNHALAHCKHCDVVYCQDCSTQWAKPQWWTNQLHWNNGPYAYPKLANAIGTAWTPPAATHSHSGGLP